MPAPDRLAARRWREALGSADRPLVGFAGRFVEEKGFDFLLRAIPQVVAECPGTRFAYAGDRNVVYEDFFASCRELVEAAAAHLDWLGLILDPQRLANFYAMCDVMAVPSRTDNLPLVPLEAMLCGTPAVIADIPGARMAVRWTGIGELVAPRDPDALAPVSVPCSVTATANVVSQAESARILDLERSLDAYERLLRG